MEYNLINLLNECRKNKPLIDAYMKGDNIENYNNNGTILGLSVSTGLILLAIQVFLFIFSVILLKNNWHRLDVPLRYISLILIFFLPIVSIIIIYVGRRG